MIAYRMNGKVCIEVRSVHDDYVPTSAEIVIAGDALPTRESLSDPAAWAQYISPAAPTLTDGTLAQLLVKKGVLSSTDVQTAIAADVVS